MAMSPAQMEAAIGQLRGLFKQQAHLLTRTRQKVFALEAAQRLAEMGRKPVYPIEFRSQFGEDLLIYNAFDGKPDGYFIEVGAFDGYQYSTTYGLECMGWTGLLIEGIPERAKSCAERRKHARVVNAALSRKGSTGTASFTVTEDPYGGMLSYLNTTHQHLAGITNAKKTSVTVPLTTMDDLLAQEPPPGGEIDVASIDVEGGELPLLQGFDLHKHRPKLLLLEENSRGADPALANYMSTQPYVNMGWIEFNAIYVRADLTDLQHRLSLAFKP